VGAWGAQWPLPSTSEELSDPIEDPMPGLGQTPVPTQGQVPVVSHAAPSRSSCLIHFHFGVRGLAAPPPWEEGEGPRWRRHS